MYPVNNQRMASIFTATVLVKTRMARMLLRCLGFVTTPAKILLRNMCPGLTDAFSFAHLRVVARDHDERIICYGLHHSYKGMGSVEVLSSTSLQGSGKAPVSPTLNRIREIQSR